MNTEQYFKINQRELIRLANTTTGKFLLATLNCNIKIFNKVVKITPNSFHQQLGSQIKATFFTRDEVANLFIPILEKLRIAKETNYKIGPLVLNDITAHFSGIRTQNHIFPQVYLAVLNQTSGAGDGNLLNISAVSWAACHDATSASDAVEAATYALSALQGADHQIRRGFYPFVTSSIGLGATITAVTLDLYPTSSGDADNDGDDFISVVQCTVADPTLLVQGDFDQWGTTRAHETSEDKDITNITLNQTLTWTFNATGRGFVSLTGTTQLGIREGHDLKNTGPVAAGNTFILTNSSADPSNKPTLNVTYTPGANDDFVYII